MFGKDFLAKLNSIWRVPLILIMTAFLSTLSVFFSLIDGTGRLQHWCAHQWASFIFFVSRVTVDVEGLGHLESGKGYIFMANHLSMFDHWAFLRFVPFQFRFVAKASLFRIPFLGWHLKRSGNVPVNNKQPRQTLRSYREVAEKIEAGLSFVIYPEGMRTFDGIMVPFKRGAFLLPKQAKAPIVPVTINGAHQRLKRGSILLRPGKMGIIIHKPIAYESYKDMKLEVLAEQVRETILGRYER